MPTIECPLAGCESQHELRHAKNKAATPFISCPTWGASTIWFRTPAASEFLNGNNGGTIENPSKKEDDFFSGEIPPEETRENPQEVEEESVLEKAAKMTNEERARFIEERQREIDRKLEAMR